MAKRLVGRARRKRRIRTKIMGTDERPRLTVFRSHRQFYVQVINDLEGQTLVSGSSLNLDNPTPAVEDTDSSKDKDKDKDKKKKKTKPLSAKAKTASQVGERIATSCLEKGIKRIVFDRNGYIYHGRVKAFADGARKGGLEF